MNAALLCPGPSLSATYAPTHDVVIGVNRVALSYKCDWWAALDWPMLKHNHAAVLGSPSLLTNAETLRHFSSHFGAWCQQRLCWTTDDLRAYLSPDGISWTLYSAPCGAVLAASLGATEVHVYGCDLAGELDWDGVQGGENRKPERWETEAGIWQRLGDALEQRGVTLWRHRVNGTAKRPTSA